ncbi:MAG: class I SAM-dependent methyltransferase [Gammaproteobacteria bacterium]|jgi:ubiquinone/menaquinone biosynthesis C-methylase UbiE|nr:class I SAM-dependent methyltransferase [Gammaproteobacteria bacterium]MDH3847511.1 class I SAM-dependent methyltransferase [Gammaproteobacteria bacterium]MDH3862963.1 class I SAM-dependent methyltransferase [Gammaproteobacteria bacterium]MDH3906477.1 class I SAM-dependent methyltransferase [Gammaproteobacteria bacterium]MDH3907590.1 class I SAM-dependent methyltransferase [Gammaproteobacteria bacterium]
MSVYEDHVLPHLIDIACSTKPTRKQREKIVHLAEGDVLEIGFGSGLNLPYYDNDKVRRVFGLEPSEGMRRKAQPNVDASGLDVEFIDLPGEEIPLESNSVDTVLVTYTLCTIPDAVAALEGMRRVLKAGGNLLFCEHGEAPDANVRRWQDRLNPGWKRFSGGCNMNRDIPGLIESSGFRITTDERMYIPGLKILSYNYWGTAKP